MSVYKYTFQNLKDDKNHKRGNAKRSPWNIMDFEKSRKLRTADYDGIQYDVRQRRDENKKGTCSLSFTRYCRDQDKTRASTSSTKSHQYRSHWNKKGTQQTQPDTTMQHKCFFLILCFMVTINDSQIGTFASNNQGGTNKSKINVDFMEQYYTTLCCHIDIFIVIMLLFKTRKTNVQIQFIVLISRQQYKQTSFQNSSFLPDVFQIFPSQSQ